MESKSESIWWEKTVEYKFLLYFCRNGRNVDAYPLAGKEEEAGDAAFSIDDAKWGLFEFKRDATSFKSELEKFAVKHDLLNKLQEVLAMPRGAPEDDRKSAREIIVTCADQIPKGKAILSGLRARGVSGSAARQQAFGVIIVPGVPTGSVLHEQARALIRLLQSNAFKAARNYLGGTDGDRGNHWIVYGESDEDHKRMKLCRIPYFQLDLKRGAVDEAEIDDQSRYVGWNRKELVGYVRQFINFKLYGVARSEDDSENGGARSWPPDFFPADPSYIVGVNDRKVLAAPLDDSTDTRDLLQRLSAPSPGAAPTLKISSP